MLHKFREVRYTDDGCSVYECLACKKGWEARTSPSADRGNWQFCPYCGVKWAGELVYDRDAAPARIQQRWEVRKRAQNIRLAPVFVLEMLVTWPEDVRSFMGEPVWEEVRRMECRAVDAFGWLRDYRSGEAWGSYAKRTDIEKVEYRLRVAVLGDPENTKAMVHARRVP